MDINAVKELVRRLKAIEVSDKVLDYGSDEIQRIRELAQLVLFPGGAPAYIVFEVVTREGFPIYPDRDSDYGWIIQHPRGGLRLEARV